MGTLNPIWYLVQPATGSAGRAILTTKPSITFPPCPSPMGALFGDRCFWQPALRKHACHLHHDLPERLRQRGSEVGKMILTACLRTRSSWQKHVRMALRTWWSLHRDAPDGELVLVSQEAWGKSVRSGWKRAPHFIYRMSLEESRSLLANTLDAVRMRLCLLGRLSAPC